MLLAKIVKSSWGHLIDILFPVTASVAALENVPIETLYSRRSAEQDAAFHAAFSYKDVLIREMILALKYKGSKRCGELLGDATADILLEILSENLSARKEKIILIPIPLSKKKREERGYNQAEIISKRIAEVYPSVFEVRSDILQKPKDTLSQSHTKTKKERLSNLTRPFILNSTINGRCVVIVDDVFTTGSTFRNAVDEMRHSGAREIVCFAITH